ncbi:MAG: LysM peptidoglycan-binding domain-containing protein [Synechococcus sp.]
MESTQPSALDTEEGKECSLALEDSAIGVGSQRDRRAIERGKPRTVSGAEDRFSGYRVNSVRDGLPPTANSAVRTRSAVVRDSSRSDFSLGSRYRLTVALIFAERVLSLLNYRELTTDLTDDIRAAAAALDDVVSLLRPLDLRSRFQRVASVLVTEGGALKLASIFSARRPVLCTGLATWLGIAAVVLARSYEADFGSQSFPFPEAAASTELTIQGVLQQNYELRLEQASQALTENELLPEAPSSGIVQHEIQEGETLWQLTQMYQLDAAAIATSNGINAQTELEPGQTLFIPRTEGVIYTVNTGDTLETIANSHEVSEADIVAATPLDNGDELVVGQQLVIPGKVEEILAVRTKVLETLAESGVAEWNLATYTSLASPPRIADAPDAASPRMYTVVVGDTLSEISRQFNTSTRELLAANPGVRSTRLQSGVTLTIPEPSGESDADSQSQPQTYQVAGGDTLELIASRHNLTVNEIIRANPTVRPNRLQVGQQITIPDNTRGPAAALPPAVSSGGFVWPVEGRMNSGFGWRWGRMHNGIDIPGAYGTPIVAVQGGTVIFAGWHTGGYGNMVKIQHPDGLVTLYAHGTSVFVSTGQIVQQGQPIMSRGSTGWSTGPHLHMEVHVNGVPVNPMRYFQ